MDKSDFHIVAILISCHGFLPPPKVMFIKLRKGGDLMTNFWKNERGNQQVGEGEERENTKILGVWDFFIFIFPLFAIILTDTAFSSLVYGKTF